MQICIFSCGKRKVALPQREARDIFSDLNFELLQTFASRTCSGAERGTDSRHTLPTASYLKSREYLGFVQLLSPGDIGPVGVCLALSLNGDAEPTFFCALSLNTCFQLNTNSAHHISRESSQAHTAYWPNKLTTFALGQIGRGCTCHLRT